MHKITEEPDYFLYSHYSWYVFMCVWFNYLLDIQQGWDETVIKQEQSDENYSEMKISLPSLPSSYIISFLFRACEEIHRIGGHVLDKLILQKFAVRLLQKVCSLMGHPIFYLFCRFYFNIHLHMHTDKHTLE